MAHQRRSFICSGCGTEAPKWSGQCADCGQWNTLTEAGDKITNRGNSLKMLIPSPAPRIYDAAEVQTTAQMYRPTGIVEFDRVLGGGLVSGAAVLIGGDPGIGKSTLLLQVVASAHHNTGLRTLYVTGEESLQQILQRAKRLSIKPEGLKLLSETQIEPILHLLEQERPDIVVIDSIQTLFSERVQSTPGSVAQVRDCASSLVYYAKHRNTTMLIVGHVTKEGALAGPRILEHMVDTVLYFENEADRRFRIIRSVKNRFGAANEIGIFAMSGAGLKTVRNPSALFLSRAPESAPGSVITVIREGTRFLLIDIQTLLDSSGARPARRVTVGLDSQRLVMLLAVLNRHVGSVTHDHDVFVNAVGGVRITETAADLAVIAAVRSSLNNVPIARDTIVFGEIGLAGEVRPVAFGEERIREAAKHGLRSAIVPIANQPRETIPKIKVIGVTRVEEALISLSV